MSKSQLYESERSIVPSRINKNIFLSSKVFFVNVRPPKVLPKSIMAPLPILPSSTEKPISATLDKLLKRKNIWTNELKIKFVAKLFSLCSELIKVSKKLFTLKPI